MNESTAASIQEPAVPTQSIRSRLGGVLASGDFRLLWAAQATTMGGDFFTYVALAWVTLDLTHSGAAVGGVLALQSVSLIAVLLFGGAVVDRATPRSVMLRASLVRAVLTGVVAALIAGRLFAAWELVPAAILLGGIGGFFMPARSSALPTVIGEDRLEAANGLLQVTTQVAGVLGPIAAGAMVAWRGNAAAFALDAAAYAVAAICLALMRAGRSTAVVKESKRLFSAVGEGLRSVWEDVPLRGVILILAAINFCAAGPLDVGLAVLARYDWGGAQSLGLVLGGFGIGAAAGAVAVSLLPRRPPLGPTIVGICLWLGAGLAAFGTLGLAAAVADAVVTGLAIGFANVVGISWIQRRTPAERLGRAMSVIMLASVGLAPISFAVSAPLVAVSPPLLFAAAGVLLALTGLASLTSRQLRSA